MAASISRSIQQENEVDSNQVSLKEAFLTNERYRRASWISNLLMVSVWLNGFQAILNWANQILDDILDEDAYITPREGVYIIGFSQFIASVISLWAVTKLDRKTLLLFGHLGSAVLLFTLGVCLTTNNKQYILWVVSAYAFVFNVSNATVINVYIVEICTDIALGASLVTMQVVILLETSTALYLIQWLKPSGFFFLYSALSAGGFLFVAFYIGETKGLTDK